MRVKKYLKNLWNDLRYDEDGQWSYTGPITQKATYTPPRGAGALWGEYVTKKYPNLPRGELGTGVPGSSYISPTYKAQTQVEKERQVGTPVTPATSQAPALSAALGYSYQPYQMPAYNVPQYNVKLPTINWGFEQTPAQQAQQQTQAEATAAQEINPQLQALKASLDQYLTQGQVQRAELNPRYTNQSLAIANIIQNTVKQEAINQAIRRNATESGWLPSALIGAGELETQQRGQVEAQRSQELAALAALETQQTQAAGEQETMLEGLRGQRITSALAELENQAWARSQQEKQNIWQSALAGEQLRASAYGGYAQNMLGAYQTQAGVGMSNADRALQAAVAAAEQGNVQWQQQFTQSQADYQRNLDLAKITQGEIGDQTITVNTPYGPIPLTIAQALQGGYIGNQGGGSTAQDIAELKRFFGID